MQECTSKLRPSALRSHLKRSSRSVNTNAQRLVELTASILSKYEEQDRSRSRSAPPEQRALTQGQRLQRSDNPVQQPACGTWLISEWSKERTPKQQLLVDRAVAWDCWKWELLFFYILLYAWLNLHISNTFIWFVNQITSNIWSSYGWL